MPRIFISYRRADSSDVTPAIYNALVAHFGNKNVFKDLEKIDLGSDFRAVVERELINSDVVLVIIGPDWLTNPDEFGNRRLDNSADFLRIEVEMALRQQTIRNLRVIPVLVKGALLPSVDQLPATMSALPYINGAELRAGNFAHDLGRLMEAIEGDTSLTGSATKSAPQPAFFRRPIAIAALLILLAAAAVGVFLALGGEDEPNNAATNPTPTTAVAQSLTDTPALAASATNTSPASATATIAASNTTTPTATDTLAPTLTNTPPNRPPTINPVAAVRCEIGQELSIPLQYSDPDDDPLSVSIESSDNNIIDASILEASSVDLECLQTGSSTIRVTINDSAFTNATSFKVTVGVVANNQWRPVLRDFQGVEMVLVPPGCFDMGSDDGESDEEPIHTICFDDAFWIDRYEVTNAQFEAFGGQAGHRSCSSEEDNHPRECIDWLEARDFCTMRSARLPTEAEWEYAARGPDSLVFPWGNTFDGTRLNYCDEACANETGANYADLTINDGYGLTAPVGSYDNASWVGAYDMSGNVWEWVSSLYDEYPYVSTDGRENLTTTAGRRVARGGAFDYYQAGARTTARVRNPPERQLDNAGFRCVRSQ